MDVAVVGSGYTGLCAARILAKSGATVAVLERETIGWGASSRNGGMATPGLKQDITQVFRKYGCEKGREFWQASVDAIDLIEQIVKDENIDCDWHRSGHVALAFKQSHYDELEDYADWIREEFGHEKTLVPRSELRSEIGTDAFYGGLSDESSGGINPAKYVFGLARAASVYGAHLYEDCSVTGIEKNGAMFEVSTTRGVLRSREVVIATNGYTDIQLPELKRRIVPVGSYIIVTEPLSNEMQDVLSPKRRMFYDTKRFINYFRLTPDGRMLWGGRNNLSTGLDLNESAGRLRKQLVAVFPELTDVTVTHTWRGKLGVSFDLMPHIGRLNGIHYANGYSGHGLSIATYLGTELGLLLSGQKERSPFAEISHPVKFFYRDRPWFLPFASGYYRFLDWLL